MLWKFRYKDRIVLDAVIEADDAAMADKVAKDHVANNLGRPGVAIIPNSVQPLAVHSQQAMEARQKGEAEAATAAEAPDPGADRSAAMAGAGTQGAGTDPASPKGKPARVGA